MAKDFRQIEWDAAVEEDCRQIIRLAVREDLDRWFDWTTVALVASTTAAEAAIVARQAGIVCGLRAAALAISELDSRVAFNALAEDGQPILADQKLAIVAGPARSVLVAERIVLNFLGRLSGIATLARQYVDAVAGTAARIYDTRKTTPGWRRLEKYAVRCGGGHNHRTGLFDAVLIKDNHLAIAAAGDVPLTPYDAVLRARGLIERLADQGASPMLLEVEVDTREQLEAVLPAAPDLVLLDNMSCDELRRAVALRDARAPSVELEASGGVNLANVAAIAAAGVDRISVGALTHSAPALDVGMDWIV